MELASTSTDIADEERIGALTVKGPRVKPWSSAVVVAIALVFGIAGLVRGQIRGLGFIQGRIVDENGAPLSDVACTAHLSRVGDRLVGTSNQKGEWRIAGMTHGEWDIACEKAGYAKGRAKVLLETELSRIPTLTIKLKAAS